METDYSPDLNSKRGRPLQELSVVDPDELDAPPPRKGFNPGPYLRMLRRKSLVILSIAGLVTGAAVIYIKGAPDTYESGFQLLVSPLLMKGGCPILRFSLARMEVYQIGIFLRWITQRS